jgi:hypothetical protein
VGDTHPHPNCKTDSRWTRTHADCTCPHLIPPANPDDRLTLIDSLDTFVVLGNISGFHEAVLQTIEEVTFDVDQTVSVFETNIRGLGGLLSAHFFAEEVCVPSLHVLTISMLMIKVVSGISFHCLAVRIQLCPLSLASWPLYRLLFPADPSHPSRAIVFVDWPAAFALCSCLGFRM